jgi:hypothetical protein
MITRLTDDQVKSNSSAKNESTNPHLSLLPRGQRSGRSHQLRRLLEIYEKKITTILQSSPFDCLRRRFSLEGQPGNSPAYEDFKNSTEPRYIWPQPTP